MNKIILTSVNGGFTWKLNDGTTDLTNPVRIDCDSSPRISKDPRCNDDNNMKYVIMDEEDRILTNPVLEDGFELDGTAILPNDLLTFLNGVCPAAAGVGGDASAANQLTQINLLQQLIDERKFTHRIATEVNATTGDPTGEEIIIQIDAEVTPPAVNYYKLSDQTVWTGDPLTELSAGSSSSKTIESDPEIFTDANGINFLRWYVKEEGQITSSFDTDLDGTAFTPTLPISQPTSGVKRNDVFSPTNNVATLGGVVVETTDTDGTGVPHTAANGEIDMIKADERGHVKVHDSKSYNELLGINSKLSTNAATYDLDTAVLNLGTGQRSALTFPFTTSNAFISMGYGSNPVTLYNLVNTATTFNTINDLITEIDDTIQTNFGNAAGFQYNVVPQGNKIFITATDVTFGVLSLGLNFLAGESYNQNPALGGGTISEIVLGLQDNEILFFTDPADNNRQVIRRSTFYQSGLVTTSYRYTDSGDEVPAANINGLSFGGSNSDTEIVIWRDPADNNRIVYEARAYSTSGFVKSYVYSDETAVPVANIPNLELVGERGNDNEVVMWIDPNDNNRKVVQRFSYDVDGNRTITYTYNDTAGGTVPVANIDDLEFIGFVSLDAILSSLQNIDSSINDNLDKTHQQEAGYIRINRDTDGATDLDNTLQNIIDNEVGTNVDVYNVDILYLGSGGGFRNSDATTFANRELVEDGFSPPEMQANANNKLNLTHVLNVPTSPSTLDPRTPKRQSIVITAQYKI